MKKVKYVATMVVEFEISEEEERELYPDGLNLDALKEEMNSGVIHEFFYGDLKSYEIKGFVIKDGKVIAEHRQEY